jgi:hypothetical protein
VLRRALWRPFKLAAVWHALFCLHSVDLNGCSSAGGKHVAALEWLMLWPIHCALHSSAATVRLQEAA